MRTVLWAALGAILLPASAFALLVFLLGAFEVCGAPSGSGGCSTIFGLSVVFAAPLGAVLFAAFARMGGGRGTNLGTRFRFGRGTTPGGGRNNP